MKNDRYVRVLRGISRFLLFFLIISFAVTCCTALFLTVMSSTAGIELTDENIQLSAKLTFLNVVVLSVLITLFDLVRRRLTVDRPVSLIVEAAKKMTEGDFSVRIPRSYTVEFDDNFAMIAEYFNQMAEELSHTETLRGDFIANVSHELKTPLAVIQNYGTLLKTPELPLEKRLEYADAITEASGRLATLITNILKLNKLENQKLTPVFATYDLSEQLCECLLDFEAAWEKKGLEISTEIEEGILVSSDADMMRLVFSNLFSNAIKFTEPGGTVGLSVRAQGGVAVVQIRDTGCGISSEVGKHMFDKFYQGDTSHATEGNGLGLALVKRVVDITGSDIAVESELGRGTVFTVKMRRVENA